VCFNTRYTRITNSRDSVETNSYSPQGSRNAVKQVLLLDIDEMLSLYSLKAATH